MKNRLLVYIEIQVLKVFLIKTYSYSNEKNTANSSFIFVALHQHLHQRVLFLTIFYYFIQHCLKKDFRDVFFFFNRFTQTALASQGNTKGIFWVNALF